MIRFPEWLHVLSDCLFSASTKHNCAANTRVMEVLRCPLMFFAGDMLRSRVAVKHKAFLGLTRYYPFSFSNLTLVSHDGVKFCTNRKSLPFVLLTTWISFSTEISIQVQRIYRHAGGMKFRRYQYRESQCLFIINVSLKLSVYSGSNTRPFMKFIASFGFRLDKTFTFTLCEACVKPFWLSFGINFPPFYTTLKQVRRVLGIKEITVESFLEDSSHCTSFPVGRGVINSTARKSIAFGSKNFSSNCLLFHHFTFIVPWPILSCMWLSNANAKKRCQSTEEEALWHLVRW